MADLFCYRCGGLIANLSRATLRAGEWVHRDEAVCKRVSAEQADDVVRCDACHAPCERGDGHLVAVGDVQHYVHVDGSVCERNMEAHAPDAAERAEFDAAPFVERFAEIVAAAQTAFEVGIDRMVAAIEGLPRPEGPERLLGGIMEGWRSATVPRETVRMARTGEPLPLDADALAGLLGQVEVVAHIGRATYMGMFSAYDADFDLVTITITITGKGMGR
jgi:hypothetical protein